MTTTIRPAATVILMRDAVEGGFEILMVKRSSRSAFGSIYVFPGGKLDPEDSAKELYSYCKGMNDLEASRKLGIERGGLAYWIACIRECFEEVGVLLTSSNDSIIQDTQKLNTLRDKLNNKEITFADIPGLIEGAHEGIGLGDKFLRHIERCKNILHLIDITNDNLIENYSKVRKELHKYSNKLTKKTEIVVFNKIDMIKDEEINKKIDVFNKKVKKKIYTMSALKHKNLTTIKKVLISYAH